MFLFLSCNNKETVSEKNNMLGNDYRLFQNTSAWELAKAVNNESNSEIIAEVSETKVNVDFQEPKFGSTLLMLSIKNSHYLSMKTLLDLGANPNIPDSYRGESAVICAANNIDPKYLKLILKYKGNPNAIESALYKKNDNVRQTALLTAINPLDSNSLQKTKILVEAGANVNYYNPGHTELPLSEAITSKHMDVVLYFLQNGADFNLMMYEMINGNEVYILEALRKCIFDLNSKKHEDKMAVIDFLKKKGLDYNKETIPDYVLEEIKKKHPENWREFIKHY